MRFSHGQPADGITGKIERYERLRVFTPNLGNGPALHDGHEHLPPGVSLRSEICA